MKKFSLQLKTQSIEWVRLKQRAVLYFRLDTPGIKYVSKSQSVMLSDFSIGLALYLYYEQIEITNLQGVWW